MMSIVEERHSEAKSSAEMKLPTMGILHRLWDRPHPRAGGEICLRAPPGGDACLLRWGLMGDPAERLEACSGAA